MEEPEDLDLFIAELLKRPLVVQPSAQIGRGLAVINCTLRTREGKFAIIITLLVRLSMAILKKTSYQQSLCSTKNTLPTR